jgi:hypothetical protein
MALGLASCEELTKERTEKMPKWLRATDLMHFRKETGKAGESRCSETELWATKAADGGAGSRVLFVYSSQHASLLVD